MGDKAASPNDKLQPKGEVVQVKGEEGDYIEFTAFGKQVFNQDQQAAIHKKCKDTLNGVPGPVASLTCTAQAPT